MIPEAFVQLFLTLVSVIIDWGKKVWKTNVMHCLTKGIELVEGFGSDSHIHAFLSLAGKPMEPVWVEDEVEFTEPTPTGGQGFHSIAADAVVPIMHDVAPTFGYGSRLAQPVEPVSEEFFQSPENARQLFTPTLHTAEASMGEIHVF